MFAEASRLGSWRAVAPDERGAAVCAIVQFWLLMTGYAVLRPLRDALGAEVKQHELTNMFLGTMVATLVLHPLFAGLASRMRRERLLTWSYRACAVVFLLLWLLLTQAPPTWRVVAIQAYFTWVTVFSLFAVSLFWSLMADLFEPARAVRLFGFLALGGTLGMVTGSLLTRFLAAQLGSLQLLWIAAVLLEASVRAAQQAARRAPARVTPVQLEPDTSWWQGLRLCLQTPYLRRIAGYLLLYTVTSTLLYYEQMRVTAKAFASTDAKTEFNATVNLIENVVTLGLQVTCGSYFVRWLGISVCLALVPLVTLLSVLGYLSLPTLWVVGVILVVRRATHFAVAKPAQELLFTVLDRDGKYKAKSFIDTGVYRFGDWIGGVFHDRIQGSYGGFAGAVAAIPLSLLWIWSGMDLGRRQRAASEGRIRDNQNRRPT